jgi:hypothetical protein
VRPMRPIAYGGAIGNVRLGWKRTLAMVRLHDQNRWLFLFE